MPKSENRVLPKEYSTKHAASTARVTLIATARLSAAVSSGVMARKVESTKKGVSRKKNLTMTVKKKFQ